MIGLKNQVGDNHAISINKFENLIKIPHYGYGLSFTKSLYRIEDIDWALGDKSKAILVFAFKVESLAKNLQYIFCTKEGDRSIYLSKTNLVIQTCASPEHHVIVDYKEHDWNICYIEFNNYKGALSRYKINEHEGTFYTQPTKEKTETIYIGGKGEYYFNGILARFDFFSNFFEEGEGFENLPDSVKKSIVKEFYPLEEDGCFAGNTSSHRSMAGKNIAKKRKIEDSSKSTRTN